MNDITALTPEKLAEIRQRYSPVAAPKCHICGAEMEIGAMSAYRTVYACSGATHDDKGWHYAPGRSFADDHYSQSRVTVADASDPDVLALVEALEARDKQIIQLQQKCEIDPRTHEIIDLKERIAELEEIATDYGMKFQRAQDDLKKMALMESRTVTIPEGLRLALSNAGIAAPESDEMLSAKVEEFIQDLVTWVKGRKPFQPAPVVPEASQQNSDGIAGMAEHYETTISMLKGRIAELESEVKFPGVMRCNTCNFSRSYVVVTPGGMRAGESVPESCPNGCGPLWHDTYRRQYNELYDAYKELESRTVTSVTYSESADADSCRKWAWEQVKGEVSTEGWTTGDNINYFGFFFWGWDMRRQYNEQRTVTVKLPERYDITGDEDGNCCFNDASMQKDPCGSFLLARDVLAMLGTAGIQVIEGEEQHGGKCE